MKKKSLMLRFLRKKCPNCIIGRLKLINGIKATKVDSNNKRYPAFWSEFECDRCGVQYRKSANGILDEVSPE